MNLICQNCGSNMRCCFVLDGQKWHVWSKDQYSNELEARSEDPTITEEQRRAAEQHLQRSVIFDCTDCGADSSVRVI